MNRMELLRAPRHKSVCRRFVIGICVGALTLLALMVCVAPPALAASTFPDVPEEHLWHVAIVGMADRGIISGYTNGNFGPNDPVTRQQFAKMIVKTMGLTVTGSEVCPFTDVPEQVGTDPFYPSKYVAVCAANGITIGKTATTFAPSDHITQQQVITMIVRAADSIVPGLLQEPPSVFEGSTFSPYADPAHSANVKKWEHNKLYDRVPYPWQTDLRASKLASDASRGLVAQMLWNLLTLIELEPPTIIGINPFFGPNAGDTTVTITGTGFRNVTGVTFGEFGAWYRVDSDTQITTKSPGLVDTEQTVDVQVTTTHGTSALSETSKFTYGASGSASGAPTVTGIDPNQAPPATSVKIMGTGFVGVSAVYFGPNPAISFTVESDTQITALTAYPHPDGYGTVYVTVVNAAGASENVPAALFTYR